MKDTLCLEKQETEIMEKEQETKQNKICEHGSQSTDVTFAQRIFGCVELILDMYVSTTNLNYNSKNIGYLLWTWLHDDWSDSKKSTA